MPYKPEGGGYSMFPRRREEEEEEERIGPSSPLRRPSQPWRRPEERRYAEPILPIESLVPELWEPGILIPDAELADPDFRYASIWETIEPGEGKVSRQEPPKPEGRGPERRGMEPRGPREWTPGPRLDPRDFFNLDAVWGAIQELRKRRDFGRGKPYAILKIADATQDMRKRVGDLMRFFRVSKEDAERAGDRIFDEIFHPAMKELAREMNRTKPRDIPGAVDFQEVQDGSIWLTYYES